MATGRLPDPNTAPLTAKGDLYTYSTVPARLAVGSNGDTLVADSSATTGLRWQGNFAAGKNKIINGAFDVWQRGTSYTVPAGSSYGAADRWFYYHNGSTNGTNTVSQQTFTPGSAPVAGYESQYFQRWTATTLGTGQTVAFYGQRIEDARTFANQTVTVSFWAKTSAAFTLDVQFRQSFGSGGSSAVDTGSGTATTTTGWQRYSFVVNIPSVSGKTIGTSSYLEVGIRIYTITAGATFDIWGVQLEAGNTATAFQTATGTLAGELAACQRYYYRQSAAATADAFATWHPAESTTLAHSLTVFPVSMRVTPTAIDYSNLRISDGYTGVITPSNVVLATVSTKHIGQTDITVTGATQGRVYLLQASSATGYIGFSAEL